jgi:heme oxygenase
MTILAEPTLSVLMRDGSRAEHTAAETSAFTSALVGGRVNADGYAAYLGRLRPVYAALESVGARLASAPELAGIVDSALDRLDALDADLAFWGGRPASASESPAVDTYVARILATTAEPARYLAHHYTRYLGDLSGGQAIGRVLARQFSLEAGAGLAFYDFSAVGRAKPYKDAYRARLDTAPLTSAQREDVVGEVRRAFALNQQIFDELSAELPRYLV